MSVLILFKSTLFASKIQIIQLFTHSLRFLCTLTTFAVRNPRGATYGYATFDLLLQRLSKLRFHLSSFIFYLFSLTTFAVRNPRGATYGCTTRDLLLQRLSKLSSFIFHLCTLLFYSSPLAKSCNRSRWGLLREHKCSAVASSAKPQRCLRRRKL